jgi:hypothetical protein
MPAEKEKIDVEDILKDAEAKKQLLDLLLDNTVDNCEIKLKGKTHQVSLDVSLCQSY